MKTNYNIGDLVWVFYSHWPKERDMAIIIDRRSSKVVNLVEYQVNFIDKTHPYTRWWSENCMEKVKPQPRQ